MIGEPTELNLPLYGISRTEHVSISNIGLAIFKVGARFVVSDEDGLRCIELSLANNLP